jgi:hypothetical protein
LYWEKPLLNWQPLFDLYTPCSPWLTHRLSSTECLWAWYLQDHSAHLVPPIHRKHCLHCHLTYRILDFSDFPLHWHVAHFEGWRSSPSRQHNHDINEPLRKGAVASNEHYGPIWFQLRLVMYMAT